MKKFLIVLLCIICILGLSGLSVYLINRSLTTDEEIIDDSLDTGTGSSDGTTSQDDDKDLDNDDDPGCDIVYFTIPDAFTSGDYVLDLNERTLVIPTCYPDYSYFTEYIIWTSSDSEVISVVPTEDLVSSCYLYGLSEGYSTITATYQEQSISFEVGVSVLFGIVNEYVYYDYDFFGFDFESRQVLFDDVEFRIPCLLYHVEYDESDLVNMVYLYSDYYDDYLSYSYQTVYNDSYDYWDCFFDIYFHYSLLTRISGYTDVFPNFYVPFIFSYDRVLANEPYTHYCFEYSFCILFEYGGRTSFLDSSYPFDSQNVIYTNFGGIC